MKTIKRHQPIKSANPRQTAQEYRREAADYQAKKKELQDHFDYIEKMFRKSVAPKAEKLRHLERQMVKKVTELFEKDYPNWQVINIEIDPLSINFDQIVVKAYGDKLKNPPKDFSEDSQYRTVKANYVISTEGDIQKRRVTVGGELLYEAIYGADNQIKKETTTKIIDQTTLTHIEEREANDIEQRQLEVLREFIENNKNKIDTTNLRKLHHLLKVAEEAEQIYDLKGMVAGEHKDIQKELQRISNLKPEWVKD